MDIIRNSLKNAFEAVRKIFNPTPEEWAEQMRDSRIEENKAKLIYAMDGYKLDDDGLPPSSGGRAFMVTYAVYAIPPKVIKLDAEQQEQEITNIKKALLDDGITEEKIEAYQKAVIEQRNQKPDFPYYGF